MWIEMDNVEEGIVNMIVQHGIKWLVMGAAADKRYTKYGQLLSFLVLHVFETT